MHYFKRWSRARRLDAERLCCSGVIEVKTGGLADACDRDWFGSSGSTDQVIRISWATLGWPTPTFHAFHIVRLDSLVRDGYSHKLADGERNALRVMFSLAIHDQEGENKNYFLMMRTKFINGMKCFGDSRMVRDALSSLRQHSTSQSHCPRLSMQTFSFLSARPFWCPVSL
ncbi:hypothetical protein BC830DRAFT_1090379 [Chytriomyces sp. MP71]|nr:hypothetical protein BC830DRAFT_1090379 [Chytriomyces sp. MP71]